MLLLHEQTCMGQMAIGESPFADAPAAGLQDEERLKKAVNQVPSNEELNAMVARSEDELVLFNQLDREMQWPDEQGTPSFLTLRDQLQ